MRKLRSTSSYSGELKAIHWMAARLLYVRSWSSVQRWLRIGDCDWCLKSRSGTRITQPFLIHIQHRTRVWNLKRHVLTVVWWKQLTTQDHWYWPKITCAFNFCNFNSRPNQRNNLCAYLLVANGDWYHLYYTITESRYFHTGWTSRRHLLYPCWAGRFKFESVPSEESLWLCPMQTCFHHFPLNQLCGNTLIETKSSSVFLSIWYYNPPKSGSGDCSSFTQIFEGKAMLFVLSAN